MVIGNLMELFYTEISKMSFAIKKYNRAE